MYCKNALVKAVVMDEQEKLYEVMILTEENSMANICNFSMMVKGKKENIEQFVDMMEQKGTVWMGRGAVVTFTNMEEVENEKCRCQIDGETKWSVQSSMVNNAISMRTEPNKWLWEKMLNKTKLSFVTLFEACKQLGLDMEVYSEECGFGFQEHYLFIDGELVKDECVDYSEKYNEETKEYESSGGFDDWDFEI